jgi:hypothetical protein
MMSSHRGRLPHSVRLPGISFRTLTYISVRLERVELGPEPDSQNPTQSPGLSFSRRRLLQYLQSTLQTKVNSIMTLRTAMRRPSGFVPLAMSGAALYVVLRHLVLFGAAPHAPVDPHVGRPDEGPEAHIWQIMMTGQVPIILYLAIRWLWSDPVGTLSVLGIQVLAVVATAAPVFLLHW